MSLADCVKQNRLGHSRQSGSVKETYKRGSVIVAYFAVMLHAFAFVRALIYDKDTNSNIVRHIIDGVDDIADNDNDGVAQIVHSTSYQCVPQLGN